MARFINHVSVAAGGASGEHDQHFVFLVPLVRSKHHALTVNVPDFEMGRFAPAQPAPVLGQ